MRKRRGARVYGPYANRRGWRVVVFDPNAVPPDRKRASKVFATEADALTCIRDIEEELATEALTVSDALSRYEEYLELKGNRRRSIDTTIGRLRAFFLGEDDLKLVDLTPRRAVALYVALRQRPTRSRKPPTADTHRNTLNETRTFARWAEKRGWVKGDPMAAVEGVGRRRRGKAQLRLDEARALLSAALEAAGRGEMGGLATALALLLGMRGGEIVALDVRDVDDGGHLLWVAETEEGKTEAARRQLEPPEPLPALLGSARAAVGSGALFQGRDRHWVLREVRRLCRSAGVPEVTAHGLRGTHASIAQDHGATGRVVAGALGHTSEAITAAHYTLPDAAQRGLARRVAAKLRLVP